MLQKAIRSGSTTEHELRDTHQLVLCGSKSAARTTCGKAPRKPRYQAETTKWKPRVKSLVCYYSRVDHPNAEHLSRARSRGDASPPTPLPHPASKGEGYFRDDAPQDVCPVWMGDNKPCGRDLYTAPSGTDERPVCLMHSQDPRKDATKLWEEIKAILGSYSTYNRLTDWLDFSSFVFLAADFNGQKFAKHANFSYTTFAQHADFTAATFTECARFYGAKFSADARFNGATFTQDAEFSRVAFGEAAFYAATFTEYANFEAATFGYVDELGHKVGANFSRARFRKANFSSAIFTQSTDFSSAEFFKDARFERASFGQFSYFLFGEFIEDADFSNATFAGYADFSNSKLRKALILDGATFGKGEEEGKVPPTPSIARSAPSIANFTNATFENPPLVRFFQVNKNSLQGFRAKFLNCPVEQFEFTDVHWHKQWGRLVLQDEVELYASKRKKKRERGEKARTGRSRTEGTQRGIQLALEYTLVAKLYRQLVNNFEKNRDYDLAEDCYVGAMEMQRLEPQGSLWTRSVLLLYKGLSNYGSSVPRAFLWVLFFVLVLFPALYSFTGIRLVPGRSGTPAGNYPGTTGSQIAPSDVSKPKKFGCSAIKEFAYTCASATWLSLEVATFQKNTTIEPATMAGRHIATIEAIVAPGQFALFFLAIRRRFKR